MPLFVLCRWIACRVNLRAGATRWQFWLEQFLLAASMCSCWCPARHVIQFVLRGLYVCQVETSNTCSFTMTVWWRHNATDAPQILKYWQDNTEDRGHQVDSDSGPAASSDDEDLADYDCNALEASLHPPSKVKAEADAAGPASSDDEDLADYDCNALEASLHPPSKVKAEADAAGPAAEAEVEVEAEVEAESEDISLLDDFGPFFDEASHGQWNPRVDSFRHNHAPSDTFLSGVPPSRLWRFSQVVKDKDVALMNATASDDVCPKGELVAHTNCIAHAYMHLQKMAAGTLPDKRALGYALSWLKRIDENNKVRRCAA